jgi:alpha-1,2-mannosyltransferase
MFAALRSRLRTWQAALAAGVFGFATPVWSVAANQMWPHTITLLGIAGMAWASSTKRWWWAGVFGGLMLWGRLHAALIVAVLGLGVGWRRRDRGIVIRIAIASGAFLIGYCAWVRWIYGTWNPSGAYGSTTTGIVNGGEQYWFDVPNQLGMWVAPDRGILVWTPVILLLLPALVRSWRTLPDWARSLAYGGLVYTVLECALNTFTGGSAFYGYRYGLEMLACATPALAMSAPAMGRSARRLVGPLLGVQFLAIALGSVTDGVGLPEWFSWKKNAFIWQIDRLGTPGWALVAASALLGWTLGLLVERRCERTRKGGSDRGVFEADGSAGERSMSSS